MGRYTPRYNPSSVSNICIILLELFTVIHSPIHSISTLIVES